MTVLPRFSSSDADRQARRYRALLRREAEIGGKLFGPLPKGHHRQFFCLDQHTWVWFESWTDSKGHRRSVTTRYEVHPNGVLKIQDGQLYQQLTRDEARNLYRAVKLYQKRIGGEYQRLLYANA